MAIIGISGKKQHGKDTVAKIINFLATGGLDTYMSIEGFMEYYSDGIDKYPWQTKRFADKLKDIVCLLINCTKEQLEDNDFKEKELGEEWRVHRTLYNEGFGPVLVGIYATQEEAAKKCYEYVLSYQDSILLTPRLLLQLIGTECGRQIIHPNIWVNALMSEYKTIASGYKNNENGWDDSHTDIRITPNWIITDVRFPNEVKAIEDKGGKVIRVNNPRIESTDNHPSETSLDLYLFEYIIQNEGSIEELTLKVKSLLIDLKII